MICSIGTHCLVLILVLEALIGKLRRHIFQVLSGTGIVREHFILVITDAITIGLASLLINHALLLFLLLQILFMPIHHGVVLVSSLLHRVCKL